MATIKSYTSLEQSKKLAEVLPLESVDMYRVFENNAETRVYYGKMPTAYFVCKPCWSLAALLSIIQKNTPYKMEHFGDKKVKLTCVLGDKPWELIIRDFDNEVDACYEMIIHLNELKML